MDDVKSDTINTINCTEFGGDLNRAKSERWLCQIDIYKQLMRAQCVVPLPPRKFIHYLKWQSLALLTPGVYWKICWSLASQELDPRIVFLGNFLNFSLKCILNLFSLRQTNTALDFPIGLSVPNLQHPSNSSPSLPALLHAFGCVEVTYSEYIMSVSPWPNLLMHHIASHFCYTQGGSTTLFLFFFFYH